MRLIGLLATLILASAYHTAYAAQTFSMQTLSYESAAEALKASVQEAKGKKHNVAIVVVDANGDIIASARMDGAKPAAFSLATRKAKTALLFRGSSRTAMEEINEGSTALLSLENLAALPGGLALQQEGKFIGAIAVSGAPADIDEAIAAAGLKRIRE